MFREEGACWALNGQERDHADKRLARPNVLAFVRTCFAEECLFVSGAADTTGERPGVEKHNANCVNDPIPILNRRPPHVNENPPQWHGMTVNFGCPCVDLHVPADLPAVGRGHGS